MCFSRNHDLIEGLNADSVDGQNITASNEARANTQCNAQTKNCQTVPVVKTKTKAHPTTASSGTKLRPNTKNTALRRKVIAKPNAPVKTAQPELKQQQQQQITNRARGTLIGLSTLRRRGNVRVTPMQNYLAVRSNFVLGPLVLKVEKSFGRGTKRELRRATATTTQMIGRITLRVINNTATLYSIKVQQPKQV